MASLRACRKEQLDRRCLSRSARSAAANRTTTSLRQKALHLSPAPTPTGYSRAERAPFRLLSRLQPPCKTLLRRYVIGAGGGCGRLQLVLGRRKRKRRGRRNSLCVRALLFALFFSTTFFFFSRTPSTVHLCPPCLVERCFCSFPVSRISGI